MFYVFYVDILVNIFDKWMCIKIKVCGDGLK